MSTRAERLDGLLAERELAALIVTDPVNIRYLTGFTGTSGVALAGTPRRFLTDFRYESQAQFQVPDFDLQIVSGDLLEALELPEGRIGFDDTQLTVRQHAKLASRGELVPATGLVEQLRAVKEPEEIEAIRAAAALIDEVFGWFIELPLDGLTERVLAGALEDEMRRRGAQGPSFPSIVASGSHGALPHAEPRDVVPERNTLLTIDMGARLDGYCSDCTRTFALGPVSAEARDVYDLVLGAQLAGLDAVRPGTPGRDVDGVSRGVIDAAGHGGHFGHGLGHGVGMEIHEGPRLSRLAGEQPLLEGNVVTVEPGVYLPGRLGVRIEDLVVVRADAPEILSTFTKQLLEIG